ncbi:hypothetical protein ASC95_04590 [Pelomonas sp. Root1217]|nr:hypothetical protein ASC95_04590 [Pelomonas sp. Root1217]
MEIMELGKIERVALARNAATSAMALALATLHSTSSNGAPAFTLHLGFAHAASSDLYRAATPTRPARADS